MKGYGLLQVYTGSGKGKTTAALGVALRDRKSTRLNSSHTDSSRMPSSA